MTAPQPWPTTRLCPATSNLPTRMLAASWQALCAAMQRREAVGARRNGRGLAMVEDFKAISAARFPCATCGGRMLPPGLELITTKEAIEMARQTKRGICELCGAHTNVGMNHGSAACPACTHVQTALNKRPEAVAKAIRAMSKTEEMLGHLIPAGGLAVKVTADLLQEISGIVGYEGEDPAELVAAVRRRVLTCASCDAEDVLHEIREIVGYSADMGDSGLAEAVRRLQAKASSVMDCAECDAAKALLEIAELVGKRGASSGLVVEAVRMAVIGDPINHCADCTALRGDLLRACGLEMDDTEDGEGWDMAAAAAIHAIAEIEYFYRREAARFLVVLEDEQRKQAVIRNDTARLNGQTHSESEQVTALRDDLARSTGVIEQLRSQLTLAQQSRDEWEQRAVQAESNVETLEDELRERSQDCCALDVDDYERLLNLALAALRCQHIDPEPIADEIEKARREA